MKVREQARLKVIASGRRGVHAWISGIPSAVMPIYCQLCEIRYNPFVCGSFVTQRDRLPVWNASFVLFEDSGRCFIERPAPFRCVGTGRAQER